MPARQPAMRSGGERFQPRQPQIFILGKNITGTYGRRLPRFARTLVSILEDAYILAADAI
jgi:hypothetical protein